MGLVSEKNHLNYHGNGVSKKKKNSRKVENEKRIVIVSKVFFLSITHPSHTPAVNSDA